MATFVNPDALAPIAGNAYQLTDESGIASVLEANTGGRRHDRIECSRGVHRRSRKGVQRSHYDTTRLFRSDTHYHDCRPDVARAYAD